MGKLNIKFLLFLSAASVALASLCIFLIGILFAFDNAVGRNIVAAVFWLSLIFGYVCFYFLDKRRKVLSKKRNIKLPKKTIKNTALGFFSNKYAFIADVAFLVLLVLTLIIVFFVKSSSIIQFLIISLFFFSVHAHFVLNGLNFKYIIIREGEKRK